MIFIDLVIPELNGKKINLQYYFNEFPSLWNMSLSTNTRSRSGKQN